MLSGPERTRGTEPCWGKASVYSRATRLPAGRRREKRAPSGRTLFPRSAPRGSGDSAEFTRSALRAAGFLLWTIPGIVHRRRVPGSTSFRPVCFDSGREPAFSSVLASTPPGPSQPPSGRHDAHEKCALQPAGEQVHGRPQSVMANNEVVAQGPAALPASRFAVVWWSWIVRIGQRPATTA